MIVKFNGKVLTIYDAPEEFDAFEFVLYYDSETETILNKEFISGYKEDVYFLHHLIKRG